MNKTQDNFVVVIRAAGERTVKVCEKLIREEIGGKAECITIECTPFEEAIKKAFRIGIESGRKWLVTVDADVLIKKGGIVDLINFGDSMSRKVFQYEGYLYDGLLLKYRQGGVKVYRGDLLPRAISMIPEPGTQIRPETYTQNKMAKSGYKRKRVEVVAGVHDYEQFYKDVYRKCYVHAVKHQEEVLELLPKWSVLSKTDETYNVATFGAFDGLKLDQKVLLDVDYFERISRDALKKYDITETKKLDPKEITDANISEILNYAGKFKMLSKREKVSKIYNSNGLINTFRWGVTEFLSILNKYIYPNNIIIDK